MGEMRKVYKATVVCLDPENGVLFAKRSDSVEQTDHIIFDDIMRIMEDYKCDVTVKNEEDGFGEWIITVRYPLSEAGGFDELYYKVVFEEEETSK